MALVCSKDETEAYALFEYTPSAEHKDHLRMNKGDVVAVNVAKQSFPEWWQGRSLSSGRSGLFPRNFVEVLPPSKERFSAVAQYDFDGAEEGTLGFTKGDLIVVCKEVDEAWWEGMLRGRYGLFPTNYVLRSSTSASEKLNASASASESASASTSKTPRGSATRLFDEEKRGGGSSGGSSDEKRTPRRTTSGGKEHAGSVVDRVRQTDERDSSSSRRSKHRTRSGTDSHHHSSSDVPGGGGGNGASAGGGSSTSAANDEARIDKLIEREAELNIEQASLTKKQVKLKKKEVALKEEETRLKKKDDELQHFESKLKKKEARLRAKEEQISATEDHLKSRERRLKEKEEEFRASRKEAETRVRELQMKLETKSRDLAHREREVKFAEEEVRKQRATPANAAVSSSAASAQDEAAMKRREERVKQREQELDKLQEELSAAKWALQQKQAEQKQAEDDFADRERSLEVRLAAVAATADATTGKGAAAVGGAVGGGGGAHAGAGGGAAASGAATKPGGVTRAFGARVGAAGGGGGALGTVGGAGAAAGAAKGGDGGGGGGGGGGNGDAEKRARLRDAAVREFVQTERDYVSDLEIISKKFLRPIRAADSLTPEDLNSIFSNVEELLRVNRGIVQLCKDRDNEASDKFGVLGDVFMRIATVLRDAYSDYCANQDNAVSAYLRCREQNAQMEYILTEVERQLNGLDLCAYLIKPVQRLCKYPLLVREVLRHTDESHADYAALKKAEVAVQDAVQAVNDRQKELEALARLEELQNQFVGLPVGFSIVGKKTRTFVFEGVVEEIVDVTRQIAEPRHVCLFNDLVLLAKPQTRSKLLTYKGHVLVSAMRVREVPRTSYMEHGFLLENTQATPKQVFMLNCKDAVALMKWVKYLREVQSDANDASDKEATKNGAAATTATAAAANKTPSRAGAAVSSGGGAHLRATSGGGSVASRSSASAAALSSSTDASQILPPPVQPPLPAASQAKPKPPPVLPPNPTKEEYKAFMKAKYEYEQWENAQLRQGGPQGAPPSRAAVQSKPPIPSRAATATQQAPRMPQSPQVSRPVPGVAATSASSGGSNGATSSSADGVVTSTTPAVDIRPKTGTLAAARNQFVAAAGGDGAGSVAALPSDWHRAKTSDGKVYYYNSVTQETSWKFPGTGGGGAAAAAGAAAAPSVNRTGSGAVAAAVHQLPQGRPRSQSMTPSVGGTRRNVLPTPGRFALPALRRTGVGQAGNSASASNSPVLAKIGRLNK